MGLSCIRIHRDEPKPDSGNVLFLILIAVALFAALSYVVTQSTRSGSGSTEKENMRLAAAEILNQFTAVQTAVVRLTVNGCSPEQISFETEDYLWSGGALGWVNNNSPTNYRCHIYRPEGGGVPVKYLKPEWLALPPPSAGGGYYYWPSGSDAITGIGTDCASPSCADLTLNIWQITKPLCEALNELSGERALNTNIPSDLLVGNGYTGSFGAHIGFANPLLRGKVAACYYDTSNGYVYNSVLIAR